MDAFTPAQTTELISRIGAKKARMRLDKMFVNSFMGGALISMGAALAVSTNSSPWFTTNAPGLIRTIGAMVFPVGLIMIILTGADLFTSYCMYSVVALLHRRCSFVDLAKTWFISFFGNLAGALVFTIVLVGYGGIFSTGAYKDEALAYAKAKAVTPQWHQIFLKGIICTSPYLLPVSGSTSTNSSSNR
jgi:formate/nitrite transporter FocA (FNT family)